MQALLQKAQEEGWADKDSNIAIRDGRMVIPVPAAFKRKLNGIVHDAVTYTHLMKSLCRIVWPDWLPRQLSL